MLRSGVEIRPATLADADDLAPRLREVDRREVEASSGDVLLALRRAVETSLDPQAVTRCGELLLLFGVVAPDPLTPTAVPWALGAPGAGRLLATHGAAVSAYLDRVRRSFPHLVNMVDARNTPALRWIRRAGFRVHPPEPFGVAGLPFHRFEMGGADV
jgi:hypothetical protein